MNARSSWTPINAIGIPIAIACCWFAGRVAWEHTVWTWERGPQMVGFSLMHSGTGLLLLLAFLFAGPIWVLTVLIFAWRKHSLGNALTWALLFAYAGAWGVLAIPGWAWERVFIERMASSPRAADMLYYAAVRGDLETVRGYIAQGLSVNARTCARAFTPIDGAARGGDLATIEYLISQGADVNSTNAYGDSPLCEAQERNHTEAIKLLVASGAKSIVGTPLQRDAATKAFVSRSNESNAACAEARLGNLAEQPCKSSRWLDRQ
ncbi:MAG: ankyrin repeat domain-containing protein [Elusimicrobia bacterium]|nr:MAG: ankyrin repeat domain-containing protein [Gammaproteobacteria bacterium]TXH23273.1 MAG: ankyrin repeat domain-containing protein [Elusimicrobiota bacterium]